MVGSGSIRIFLCFCVVFFFEKKEMDREGGCIRSRQSQFFPDFFNLTKPLRRVGSRVIVTIPGMNMMFLASFKEN